ncbi:MAG: hypothetical protein NTX03_07160 [Bacteroidetes bacterium]|nr:hypothetical protein [Bacteroidota bacterium]
MKYTTVKTLIIVSAIAALTACASLTKPAQKDTDITNGKPLTDLEKGMQLCKANCGKCHGVPKPNERNEKGWQVIIPPMQKKAKIDDATAELILKYLVAGAKK